MSRIFYILFALLLTACGSSDSFEISGEVEGLGTQNLRVVYRDAAALRSATTTAIDSKFRFEGNSPEETVVEFYTNARALLGRVIVKNGESLHVKFLPNDPNNVKVSGNKNAEALASFLAKNGSADNLNAIIEAEVAKNPAGILSAALVNYYYDAAADPVMADSLLRMLDYTLVPRTVATGLHDLITSEINRLDTLSALRLYCPGDSLSALIQADEGVTLCYFDEGIQLPDSVVDHINRDADRYARIIYLRLNPDTIGWRRQIGRLPKGTQSYWLPASLSDPAIAPLAIPSLPYVLTLDSLSRITTRSPYIQ